MKVFATDLEKLDFLLEADLSPELALLSSEAADDVEPGDESGKERPKYISNYIGSKQKLVDWIWKNTPDGVKSVIDAFCGSAVVGYMYKTKGLQVITNDRLKFAYHTARAIVENKSVTLSDDETESLVADNSKAGDFVQKTFKGMYFKNDVLKVIDEIRANIEKFSGYKKDIALFALGRVCTSGGFGHFSSTTEGSKRKHTAESFKSKVIETVKKVNALVFDNGHECKALNMDIQEALAESKVDLAYFDPPYATHFSTTNYEKIYHFVEGLMVYWKGLEIESDNKVRNFKTDHKTVTKGNANEFFTGFLGQAKHIPHWMISYRDKAYPSEPEMKKIIGTLGKDSRMFSKDHEYKITKEHGEASHAKERLFVCQKAAVQKAAASDETDNCLHTSLSAEICLCGSGDLQTQAADIGEVGDKRFDFILCHVGTNKNGDHFLREELESRHQTVVNKKIDLKHSQDITDIVGGVVSSDFVNDEKNGHVDCVGELFINENIHSRLAYKLMKKGIITQVSMECDYGEGECSVCGKRVKSKAEYCVHLKKFKGKEYQGELVYEILHGITFTGLGLLDRKGADEDARIKQVASKIESDQEGGKEDMAKDKTEQDGAPTQDNGGDAPDKNQAARIKELEGENQKLKAQIAELQKELEALRMKEKAAANRARSEKLIKKLEKAGHSFGEDDEREKEIDRLADLSDDAFAATEAAYSKFPKPQTPKDADGDDGKEPDPKKDEGKTSDKDQEPNAQASRKKGGEGAMRSDAGVKPLVVDDKKLSLQERLSKGLMAAYNERVESEA